MKPQLNFSSLFDLMEAYPTEESCIKLFETLRWGDKIVSPFNEDAKVYKCKAGRYKCSVTDNYFNVRTNSIFHGSKLPLRKWLFAIYLVSTNKKGISSIQLGKTISVKQQTAWKMLKRIRSGLGDIGFWGLKGTIEIDESFVGGKFKSRRRHHYKKEMGKEPSPVVNKATVFGMIQRDGRVSIHHLPDRSKHRIIPLVEKRVWPGSRIMSDEYYSFRDFPEYIHGSINHGKHEYANGEIHTNTIENFWSTMKRTLYGTYHWASRKHLQLYLNEIQFRFNHRNICDHDRTIICLKNALKPVQHG